MIFAEQSYRCLYYSKFQFPLEVICAVQPLALLHDRFRHQVSPISQIFLWPEVSAPFRFLWVLLLQLYRMCLGIFLSWVHHTKQKHILRSALSIIVMVQASWSVQNKTSSDSGKCGERGGAGATISWQVYDLMPPSLNFLSTLLCCQFLLGNMSIRKSVFISILSPSLNLPDFWIVECGKKPDRVNSGVLNLAPCSSSRSTIWSCSFWSPSFFSIKTTSVVPNTESLVADRVIVERVGFFRHPAKQVLQGPRLCRFACRDWQRRWGFARAA